MGTELLGYRERPVPAPQGGLVLFHGRGADEHDLFPLFDEVDPDRLLLGACPRGPLSMPPGGAHWYAVYRVGFPDPETFYPTFQSASEWLDSWVEESGLTYDKVVLGGFSQGCVMSYALAFGPGRPRPAGVLGLSGFIPIVDGFEFDLSGLDGYPVAIGHGIYDPVIEVGFGRSAKERLEEAGAEVTYRESPMPHTIDPTYLPELRGWLKRVLSLA